MSPDPYAEHRDQPPEGSNLAVTLTSYADESQQLARRIEEIEDELTKAKARQKDLIEVQIPDLMDGMTGTFTLTDGRTIKVDETLRVSLSKENEPEGLQWLKDNGSGAIISTVMNIDFGKGNLSQAREFEKFIIAEMENPESKLDIPLKKKETVHFQTLQATIKAMRGDGVEIPEDIFSIFNQRKAKIK